MPTATASKGVYLPRHPEGTPLYKLFEEHFEHFTRVYEERFEHQHGFLRRVVPRVVDQYLECGRPEGGFARIRCPSCRGEHLLAFSCQTRNFCPSCQAKRGALFGERLIEEVLADVPHRHVTFTIPKALRGLFERERKLLKILPQCTHRAVEVMLREVFGRRDVRVGTVASIQTFGDLILVGGANFHPHVHAIVADGVFHPLGAKALYFERVEWWDVAAVARLFREYVFAELMAAKRLRPETAEMMRSWDHSGFNVHASEPVLPTDRERLEKIARYDARAPLALDAMQLLADSRVRVRTPHHPQTGATRMDLDAVEMIRRLCAQIPDPRQHMVTYYGWYSHRARGERRKATAAEEGAALEVEVRFVGGVRKEKHYPARSGWKSSTCARTKSARRRPRSA